MSFAGYQYLSEEWHEDALVRHSIELAILGTLAESFNLDGLTLSTGEIFMGGPPKDGIPSLTTLEAETNASGRSRWQGRHPPSIAPLAQADLSDPKARIVGIKIGDAVRAYPINILNWHECINDVLDGVPIAVVYCPLCDSVTVIDRRIDGRVLEFGISGLLYNSNVLLYDRTDHALWSQIGMEAVSGPLAGRRLTHINGWEITTLDQWTLAHPDSDVLTFDTGFDRDYEHNAYELFSTSDEIAYPVGRKDSRMSAKARIIGVRLGNRAKAYPLSEIVNAPAGVLRDRFTSEHEIVLAATAEGGVRIERLPPGADAIHTFWFAWAATYPQTEVHKPSQP